MLEQKYQIETSDHHCESCGKHIACGADYFSAIVFAEDRFARRNFCPPCWNGRGRAPAPPAGADPSAASPTGNSADASAPAASDPDFYAYWRTKRPEEAGASPRRIHFDPDVVLDFFRHLDPDRDDGDTAAEGAEGSGEGDDRRGDAAPEEPPPDAAEGPSGTVPAAPAGETVETVESEAAPDDESAETERSGPADRPATGESSAGEASHTPPETSARSPAQRKRDLRFVLALLLIRKKALNFQGSRVEDGREWLKLTEKGDPERVFRVENPDLTAEELERVRDDLGELLEMNL